MNHITILLAAIFALGIYNMGCKERMFVNVGKDAQGHEVGVPNSSIDTFAKEHGISREEARKNIGQEVLKERNSPGREAIPDENQKIQSPTE